MLNTLEMSTSFTTAETKRILFDRQEEAFEEDNLRGLSRTARNENPQKQSKNIALKGTTCIWRKLR